MIIIRRIKSQMTPLSVNEVQKLSLELAITVHEICIKNNINYYMIGGALIGAVRNNKFVPWDDDIDFAMLREDYERFLAHAIKELPKNMYLQNMLTDNGFIYPLTRVCLKNTYRKESLTRKERQYLYMDIFPIDNIPNRKISRFNHKLKVKILKQLVLRKTCPVYDEKSGKMKNIVKKFLMYSIPGSSLFWKKKLVNCMKHYNNTHYVSSLASKYGYDKQVMSIDTYGTPAQIELCGRYFNCPSKWDEYLTNLYGDYLTPPTNAKYTAEIYVYEEEDFASEQ